MSIDTKLFDSLEKYRDKILIYLFNNNGELINDWLNNKPIKIKLIYNKILPMLGGDWERFHYKHNKTCNVNLCSILQQKTITKEEFFNKVHDVLNRNPKPCPYNHNINPNLFFLFFEEFLDCEIKEAPINIEPLRKDENSPIIGIIFKPGVNKNYEQVFLRSETRSLLELHSRFVLNKKILNCLGEDKFIDIFIKNCYIQYKVNLYQVFAENDNYADLCYIVNDQELFLEIKEAQHNTIKDYKRELSITTITGSRAISCDVKYMNKNIDKIFSTIITEICRILIQSDDSDDLIKSKAMLTYLVLIEGLNFENSEISIQIYYNLIDIKLSSLLNLPILNDCLMNINDLIRKYIKENFSFEQINDNLINDFKKNNSRKKLLLIIEKLNEDYDDKKILSIYKKSFIQFMDDLYLTTQGLKSFLNLLNSKSWLSRGQYNKFNTEVQKKFLDGIQNLLLTPSQNQLNYELRNYQVLFNLKKYNPNIFFQKLKEKNLLLNKYHNKVPFIIKATDKEKQQYGCCFVDTNHLMRAYPEYRKLFIPNSIETCDTNYLEDYRLMTIRELENVYN